ncbi:hypothetical protein L7F22_068340 [Adiantum nelumboides]|nr:hypothetical protein [Adiantum nelumboides]
MIFKHDEYEANLKMSIFQLTERQPNFARFTKVIRSQNDERFDLQKALFSRRLRFNLCSYFLTSIARLRRLAPRFRVLLSTPLTPHLDIQVFLLYYVVCSPISYSTEQQCLDTGDVNACATALTGKLIDIPGLKCFTLEWQCWFFSLSGYGSLFHKRRNLKEHKRFSSY